MIAGAVVDPSNAAAVGATVTEELLPNAPCLSTAAGLMPSYAVTNAPSGRFAFSNVWTGGNKCWRLWATPPAGSGLSASDTVLVNIDFSGMGAKPDSVELLLRLR